MYYIENQPIPLKVENITLQACHYELGKGNELVMNTGCCLLIQKLILKHFYSQKNKVMNCSFK